MGDILSRKLKIAFVTTTISTIHYRTVSFLLSCATAPNFELVSYLQEGHTSAAVGQERILQKLQHLDYDYVLMVDSDVAPPADALLKLLAVQRDIVVAPVWHFDINTEDIHLNIHYTQELDPENRIYKVKDSGVEKICSSSFAVMLLSREVFKRFREAGESYTTYTPFLPPYFEGRESDNIFFGKAYLLGLDAYVCWDVHDTVHCRAANLSTRIIEKLRSNL